LIGSVLAGKYQILSIIGAGAMGRVYRAHHMQMGAQMAVKVLSPQYSADPQTIWRFHHEARAAARLRHPNSIRIHDFGQDRDGLFYLVMELLTGKTLGQVLRQGGQLPGARIVNLLSQALLALDEAHHAGIIHRDFKPDNIFIEQIHTRTDHVKVLDFGIAKDMGGSGVTHAGSVCGTPDYMSPEQIRGEPLDGRSDVYAAGVVLYELLTGYRPFEGSLLEVLSCHVSHAPVPPSKRVPGLRIPPSLEQVCLKAMSKRREDRYASAAEMEQALRQAGRALAGRCCPACSEAVPPRVRFCPWCGGALQAAAGEMARPKARWPSDLLGREEALDSLHVLDQRALLLWGPSGIGKSRLVEAWIARSAAGRPVVRAYPDPSCAGTPLYPIRTALAQALRIPDRPSLQELDQALITLRGEGSTGDRAGLAELFGVSLSRGAAHGAYDVRRRECFAAAVQTLGRLPLIFVFEDIDRYDGPSLEILKRLCQEVSRATVLLTSSVPPTPDLVCEALALPPLPPEVLDDLGLPPSLLGAAGGIPRELEQRCLALAEGAADISLAGRIGLLSADSFSLLAALAVAGTRAPFAQVCEVAGLAVAGAEAQRQDLALRGLLRVCGDILELPSPSFRDLIYERVDEARRRALHRAWHRLLEGGDRSTHAIVLAHHALRGDPERISLSLMEQAGDAARQSFDDEAAEAWFRRAVQRARHMVQTKEAPKEVLIQAGLRLALTLRYAGKIVDAEQTLREILRLGKGDARAEADARRGLSRLADAWDQPAAAQHELHGAIRAAWRAGDPGLLVELYQELAEVMARSGDAEAAERELREGIDSVTSGEGMAARSGPPQLWRLFLSLGELLHLDQDRQAEALACGRRALQWARAHGSPEGLIKAQKFLGLLYKALGQPRLAARHHRAALEEARLLGDRRSTADVLIVMADAVNAAEVPDSRDSARALLMEASALSQQIGWDEGMRLIERQMADLDKPA
jgi:serine/threonine-protein kinase